MDWIRIETGLPDHPKVGRLARRLKVDRDRALAIVVRLLCWVGRMKERGQLSGTEAEDIAEVCRWDGEPDELLTALRGAGWIDSTDAGDVVHDWMERQGSVFRTRERVARSAESYAKATRSLREGYAKPTDLQTDRQTDRQKHARPRERDRPPAGAGAVARTYREWEPPRTEPSDEPVDTSRMAATLARRADEAEAAGRTAEAEALRKQIAKYLAPASTPEETPA